MGSEVKGKVEGMRHRNLQCYQIVMYKTSFFWVKWQTDGTADMQEEKNEGQACQLVSYFKKIYVICIQRCLVCVPRCPGMSRATSHAKGTAQMWCKSQEHVQPWPDLYTGISTHPAVECLLIKLENSVVSSTVIKTTVKTGLPGQKPVRQQTYKRHLASKKSG